MNNRFKFRGVLTVAYSSDDDEDKTVDLIIEKADAIYGGCIGFDIDQLDAAIEKAGITDDIEIDNIHEFCYDNNGCRSDEYFVMDGDIKQCTGLSDKNGNLIYEGNVVKIGNGSINGEVIESDLVVEWICKNGRYNLPTWTSDVPDWSHYVEIIGNIHENKGE